MFWNLPKWVGSASLQIIISKKENYPHQKNDKIEAHKKRFSSRDVMAIYHFLAQSTAKCQIWPFLFCDFFRQTFGLDSIFWIFSQSYQIFSHERNWHKNDYYQKLSNSQNFNSWVTKLILLNCQVSNGYNCTNLQGNYNCSALDLSVFLCQFVSWKRSDRIERKCIIQHQNWTAVCDL